MKKSHFILLALTMMISLIGLIALKQHRTVQSTKTPALSTSPSSPSLASLPTPDSPVSTILTMNGGVKSTLKNIENLPSDLSATECQALLDFATGPEKAGIGSLTWAAVSNDILNALRRQDYLVDHLTALSKTYHDSDAACVLRDYAIQHIGAWLANPKKTPDENPNAPGLNVLWHAASSSEALSATALLALNDLAKNRPGMIDGTKLNKAVLHTVTHPATPTLARISSLQIAAERQLTQVLPVAREICADKSAPTSLKLSAIACLAKLGDTQDHKFLKTLQSDPQAARYQAAIAIAFPKETTP